MNKMFLGIVLASAAFGFSLALVETKQQKIEQLFELTNDKQMFLKAYEPVFVNANITDEQIKKTAIDKFFIVFKQDYVTVYDKMFNETEIDEMVRYYSSPTGKHVTATALELGVEMQKAYVRIMTIIQDLIKQEKVEGSVKSTAISHFDELAKGKSDNEIKELFDKSIQNDGLTIVKFSAIWCGPCKMYASIFEEVAEQFKELTINGKKVSIQYVAIDIDAVPAIAKECSIASVPTTIFYNKGKKVDSKVGYIKKDELISQIQELIKK